MLLQGPLNKTPRAKNRSQPRQCVVICCYFARQCCQNCLPIEGVGRYQILSINPSCKASYSSPLYAQTLISWLNEGTSSLLITFRFFLGNTSLLFTAISHNVQAWPISRLSIISGRKIPPDGFSCFTTAYLNNISITGIMLSPLYCTLSSSGHISIEQYGPHRSFQLCCS